MNHKLMKTLTALVLAVMLAPAYARGEASIETPTGPGIKMHHMVTIRLNGRPGSGIRHVINGQGTPVITTRKAIID